MIKRLDGHGLLRRLPGHRVELTEHGMAHALGVVRRHRAGGVNVQRPQRSDDGCRRGNGVEQPAEVAQLRGAAQAPGSFSGASSGTIWDCGASGAGDTLLTGAQLRSRRVGRRDLQVGDLLHRSPGQRHRSTGRPSSVRRRDRCGVATQWRVGAPAGCCLIRVGCQR